MSLLHRVTVIVSLFSFVLLAGTLGYHVLEGWPLLECFYMAVITVTTVGFSEVHPLSSEGRLFTALLILMGVAVFTYAFGALSNYVIAGELQGFLAERRTRRRVRAMKNHVIVCGYGRRGHEVCRELEREKRPFIVVDEKEDSVRQAREDGYLTFHGDPGLDETLQACGIDRAAGLVAALFSSSSHACYRAGGSGSLPWGVTTRVKMPQRPARASR